MKRDYNQIPAWTAAETLIDAPGVIRQSELELLDEVRDAANNVMAGNTGVTQLSRFLDVLEGSLNARFESGELIEMGSLDFSRDANGRPLVWRGISQIQLN